MARRDFSEVSCSIARALEIIGDRWTLLVLRDLFVGVTRFDDIRRDLGIATNVLTERLALLTDHGVVERREYQAHPPRHDYLLTEKGRDLFPVLAALVGWGDRWEADDTGPPALLVHDRCGQVSTPVTRCACCGEPMSADDVTPIAGPGHRTGRGTEMIGPILAARAESSAAGAPRRHTRSPRCDDQADLQGAELLHRPS